MSGLFYCYWLISSRWGDAFFTLLRARRYGHFVVPMEKKGFLSSSRFNFVATELLKTIRGGASPATTATDRFAYLISRALQLSSWSADAIRWLHGVEKVAL